MKTFEKTVERRRCEVDYEDSEGLFLCAEFAAEALDVEEDDLPDTVKITVTEDIPPSVLRGDGSYNGSGEWKVAKRMYTSSIIIDLHGTMSLYSSCAKWLGECGIGHRDKFYFKIEEAP